MKKGVIAIGMVEREGGQQVKVVEYHINIIKDSHEHQQ
jgi:hypothetical protein